MGLRVLTFRRCPCLEDTTRFAAGSRLDGPPLRCRLHAMSSGAMRKPTAESIRAAPRLRLFANLKRESHRKFENSNLTTDGKLQYRVAANCCYATPTPRHPDSFRETTAVPRQHYPWPLFGVVLRCIGLVGLSVVAACRVQAFFCVFHPIYFGDNSSSSDQGETWYTLQCI